MLALNQVVSLHTRLSLTSYNHWSYSENGNFCQISVTVGLMLSTNQSDTSNTGRHCFLSKYHLFYATTKETMAGTPAGCWLDCHRLHFSSFSFSLLLPLAKASRYNGNFRNGINLSVITCIANNNVTLAQIFRHRELSLTVLILVMGTQSITMIA